MSYKEKVERAVSLLHEAGIVDRMVNTTEIYTALREMKLNDVAESLADFINLVYALRDVLEGES